MMAQVWEQTICIYLLLIFIGREVETIHMTCQFLFVICNLGIYWSIVHLIWENYVIHVTRNTCAKYIYYTLKRLMNKFFIRIDSSERYGENASA